MAYLATGAETISLHFACYWLINAFHYENAPPTTSFQVVNCRLVERQHFLKKYIEFSSDEHLANDPDIELIFQNTLGDTRQ